MAKLEIWQDRCPAGVRPGCEPKYIENENNQRAIVLLHGLTDSPYFMEAIGKRFAQLGFNVYIPLLPGHGLKDPKGMKGVTLKQWKKEVNKVVSIACGKAQQVSIGGLSTGGTLSVWKASKNPDQINGGVFLFSAALDIADDENDSDNPFKKGNFKERLLRTYCIRKPLAIVQDLKSPLVGNDPGDNPYRYSRMDYDGAAQLAECIKKVEKAKLTQPLFVAHSEADEAADILGVEELMLNHQGDREQVYYYRIGKTLGVPHASVVLENDVLSYNGSPLEPKNPFFNKMMNRVTLFINQQLNNVPAPKQYTYRPQVAVLKDIFFDYHSSTYSPGIAHWLAYCSQIAYQRRNGKKDKSPHTELILERLQGLDPDFEKVYGFNNRSSQAILIKHKHFLVAAFRGTDEVADWIDNISVVTLEQIKAGFRESFKKWLSREQTFSTNYSFGRVHQGFYQAFLDVWERDGMWEKLEELIDLKQSPLWVTGHSLGGAMATFAGAWLAERNLPVRGIYTFGQPRCGDKDFSIQLNAKLPNKIFRFHNSNDIVPRLPARLMNFEHTGKLIYITEDRKLDANPTNWDRFLERAKGIIKDFVDKDFVPDSIEDHNIVEGYINGISAWQDRNPENWS
ncbi:MAG: alpha/beta hydrolase [Xenococcus sp. MO_188.B8]|nr:alpha/beta hydrolase [Xenococcus sp. MO_188.B8]